VHVTLRLRRGLPSLRMQRPYAVLRRVFRHLNPALGLRVVHHSAQRDHVHLIVEVDSRRALSRGMQGLTIRLAKAMNKEFGRRRGPVLRDRYHAEVLRTPRQVKNTLSYVLNNLRHHLRQLGAPQHPANKVDSRSSAPWFDGWRRRVRHHATGPPPHPPPRSWLLRTGWRRHGLLDPAHVPGG
jgi:REP element-mobilizing transposase RayT